MIVQTMVQIYANFLVSRLKIGGAMTISLVAMATATSILFSDVVFELIEERICSLVGRGGSRAPKDIFFLHFYKPQGVY